VRTTIAVILSLITGAESEAEMSWPSPVESVEVTIGGVIYEGTYYVQKSIVYVQSPYGSKATQVGGSSPEALAKMLLSELVRASFSTD
jgi:hypothetical protein